LDRHALAVSKYPENDSSRLDRRRDSVEPGRLSLQASHRRQSAHPRLTAQRQRARRRTPTPGLSGCGRSRRCVISPRVRARESTRVGRYAPRDVTAVLRREATFVGPARTSHRMQPIQHPPAPLWRSPALPPGRMGLLLPPFRDAIRRQAGAGGDDSDMTRTLNRPRFGSGLERAAHPVGVAGPRRVLWAPARPSGRAGQRGASYESDDRPAGLPLPTSRVAGPSAALALGYGPTSGSRRDVLRGKLRLAKGPRGHGASAGSRAGAGPTRPGDINCLVSGVGRCWYR